MSTPRTAPVAPVLGAAGAHNAAPAALGGEAGAAPTRRFADALACLRDSVPEAMEMLIHLSYQGSRDMRAIGASGDWAYSIRRDGMHFEAERSWLFDAHARGERWGYDRTPARHVTWEELAGLLADHPARPGILAWAAALPYPSWQELTRPKELWPNPGQWHPDCIPADHARPGWPERIAAWRALQQICTDAVTALAELPAPTAPTLIDQRLARAARNGTPSLFGELVSP